jgi:hypothetical protein
MCVNSSIFISFHLVVCLCQRNGRRLSRNGCWNHHIGWRERQQRSSAARGEGLPSMHGDTVSVVPDSQGQFLVIIPCVSISTSCAYVGLSLSRIVTCCAVLRGQSCDMWSVLSHRYLVASCPLSDIRARYPPIVNCNGICFTMSVCKSLNPLPTRYW